MSTLSSANVTDVNLVLKERTHRIKIKYSMHQYSIRLHNLDTVSFTFTYHTWQFIIIFFTIFTITTCIFSYSFSLSL